MIPTKIQFNFQIFKFSLMADNILHSFIVVLKEIYFLL